MRRREKSLKREQEESEIAGQTRADLLVELNTARSLLIEGEIGEYLESLYKLADSEALRPHCEKKDELWELKESAKFGGYSVSPDQLRWAEKLVRNAIRKAFPDKDGQEEE